LMNSVTNIPMRTYSWIEYWWRMHQSVPVFEACS
jgi:hypothetical protein